MAEPSQNWFAKIERHVIARGVFRSTGDLRRKLLRYIRHYNKNRHPPSDGPTPPRNTESNRSHFIGYTALVSQTDLNRDLIVRKAELLTIRLVLPILIG